MSTIRKLLPLLAASVLLVGFTGGASAYQCKTQAVAVSAPGADQGTAITVGRALWTSNVRKKFGLEWSVWSIAAAPSQNCSPAGGGYQCIFTAKPCKYVVQ
jgi:hypothetical protein